MTRSAAENSGSFIRSIHSSRSSAVELAGLFALDLPTKDDPNGPSGGRAVRLTTNGTSVRRLQEFVMTVTVFDAQDTRGGPGCPYLTDFGQNG